MKPFNLGLVLKGGRGSIVPMSTGRELNIYSQRNGCGFKSSIFDNRYFCSVPKGPRKIINRLSELKNRNIQNPHYLNDGIFKLLLHDDLWVFAYLQLDARRVKHRFRANTYDVDKTTLTLLRNIKKEILSGYDGLNSCIKKNITKQIVFNQTTSYLKFKVDLVITILKLVVDSIYCSSPHARFLGCRRTDNFQHLILPDVRKNFEGINW